jgi:hypothetical protein
MADGLSFICMNIILQVCSPADSAAAVAMTMAAAAKAPMHTLEKATWNPALSKTSSTHAVGLHSQMHLTTTTYDIQISLFV